MFDREAIAEATLDDAFRSPEASERFVVRAGIIEVSRP